MVVKGIFDADVNAGFLRVRLHVNGQSAPITIAVEANDVIVSVQGDGEVITSGERKPIEFVLRESLYR